MRKNLIDLSLAFAWLCCVIAVVSSLGCCHGTSVREGYSPVVSRVLPQVIEIHTQEPVKVAGETILIPDGSGSAVVVDRRGYLLTCWHVVRNTAEDYIEIDGNQLAVTVVAHDETLDLALVRVEHTFTSVVEWGDSSTLKSGDQVFVVGYPFDVCQSVSLGIISCPRIDIQGVPALVTDAAINPGNSGGGLFDTDGGLIGIPSRIYCAQGLNANVGMAFAIPGNTARWFVITNLPIP